MEKFPCGTSTTSLTSAKQGEIVTFGTYPHSANGTDKTPIQWRVLQNAGDELFLLSEYIIDCKRYHNKAVDTSWGDCDMRKWLNSEMFRIAFTAAEQERIKTTLCTNNGEDSPDTEDKVFLLSVVEVEEFTSPQDGDKRRRTIGTEYAKTKKADGCRLGIYDKSVEKDYIIENGKKQGCSWWWTRTQSQRQIGNLARATFIGARSNIKRYGQVDLKFYGVRPAIKLDMSQ